VAAKRGPAAQICIQFACQLSRQLSIQIWMSLWMTRVAWHQLQAQSGPHSRGRPTRDGLKMNMHKMVQVWPSARALGLRLRLAQSAGFVSATKSLVCVQRQSSRWSPLQLSVCRVLANFRQAGWSSRMAQETINPLMESSYCSIWPWQIFIIISRSIQCKRPSSLVLSEKVILGSEFKLLAGHYACAPNAENLHPLGWPASLCLPTTRWAGRQN